MKKIAYIYRVDNIYSDILVCLLVCFLGFRLLQLCIPFCFGLQKLSPALMIEVVVLVL